MTRFLTVSFCLSVQACLVAQTPTLVRDINTRSAVPSSSRPSGGNQGGAARAQNMGRFVAMGATRYFQATDALNGNELYRTLGVPGSTRRVTDVAAGALGANVDYITVAGGLVFFSATDRRVGQELYVHDPAAPVPNSRLVLDIHPTGDSRPTGITAVGSRVFFSADDGVHGTELWVSDGTAAGTKIAADIYPGSASSVPDFLIGFQGRVFFAATGPTGGRELWESDGTLQGTREVADIWPGAVASGVAYLTVYAGALYFSADDGMGGAELWRYRLGVGAQRVHDVWPGTIGSKPRELTVFRGQLWFSASSPTHGTDLWRTDGTTLTALDVRSGTGSATPTVLTVFGVAPNERLAFAGFADGTGKELYVHDGVQATLVDVEPGTASSDPGAFAGAGNVLLFRATRGNDVELWRSDGTAAGTSRVRDINPGGSSFPDFMTEVLGRVVFSADDGIHGHELWGSDGTTAGTAMLADIDPNVVTAGSNPAELVDAHGVLYFRAEDGQFGRELFRSDGTAAGTRLVADLMPGPNSSQPTALLVAGNTLWFIANRGGGDELHRLDLATDRITPTGLFAVSATPPFAIHELAAFGGRVFLLADGGPAGPELFATDGTNHQLVRDINPGSAGCFAQSFVEMGGRLYFSADDGVHGAELWVTDGTQAGTRLVVDLQPGAVSSHPEYITPVGDRLVFRAIGPSAGQTTGGEPVVSDGTAAGTRFVDLLAGLAGSNPTPAVPIFPYGNSRRFAVVGGSAYFAARAAQGAELYRSDGTVGGTVIVADIATGRASSSPSSLAPFGDRLLFRATGAGGAELWRTDGTAAGTLQVADLIPGPTGGAPFNIAAAGSRRVWFTAMSLDAQNRSVGFELHVSDGTVLGTTRVADLNPGAGDSAPGDFTVSGSRLFFTALHPTFGRELFVLDPGALAQRAGGGCNATGPAPVLDSDDPVLGRPVTTSVRGAPASGVGVLLIGLRAAPPNVVVLPGGCEVRVDLGKGVIPIGFPTNAAGAFDLTLQMPNNPALIGGVVALQAGVGPSVTQPMGLDVTNVLVTTYGR